MYDFYSDRTIFSSRSRPSPRKSLRIVRRSGRRFLPARLCTGRTGSGNSFPMPPAPPRQPTECRTSARRIFLSAGFCTSPHLHAPTPPCRLHAPLPPDGHRSIPPHLSGSTRFRHRTQPRPAVQEISPTQTRRTRLRPYFDKPDENGPPGRGSFPSPTGRYPPTTKIFLPFILPKRSANRHTFSPTEHWHARRKGNRSHHSSSTSLLHPYPMPSPPCTQRKRPGNPRRSSLTSTSTRRNRERFAPPPSSRPVFDYRAKKVESPRHKIFSTASHPDPACPYSSGIGRIPDPPDLPCGCRTKIATGKTDRSPPRLRATDARIPADRHRHEPFVCPLKQTVARRYTKLSTLRPLPATEVCRAHFPAVHRPENRVPRPSSAKHKIRSSGRSISLRERKPSGKNRKQDIRKADNEKSRTGPPSKPPQQNLLVSAHRTSFSRKSPLSLSRNATPSERCLFMRYNRCSTSEAIRIKRYSRAVYTLSHHFVFLGRSENEREDVLPDTLPCILSSLILRARGIPAIRRVWRIRHP